jgi:hypothetical protein
MQAIGPAYQAQVAGAAGATRTKRKSQARLEPRVPSASRRRGWSHADRSQNRTAHRSLLARLAPVNVPA